MIELIVYNYLKSYFAESGISVYMEKPANPDPEGSTYILIEKTGSSRTNYLYNATIAVQSYAPTLYGAAELNERAKEAMLNIITEDRVTKSSLNSDYNFTDTSTKQPRYQAVFELTHY